jgi:Domain of unknown function (DUF4157)
MADQDGKATGRMVRALRRAPLEPGRELRRGARFPEPSDARDRIGPAVEHEALPIAYASTLAASTSVNPSRAARSIWRLHQTLGNRSVQRVIARARSIDGDRMRYAGIHMVQPNPDRVQTMPDEETLQTGCACGARAPGAQAKLSVSEPGDQYEQEADRIATVVMQREQRGAVSGETTAIQRQESLDTAEADLSSVVAHGTSGGGRALGTRTRTFMESRFGRDFGDVRVHTGLAAEESARSVGAVAYTIGGDIVFGAGHYAPHTTEGRWLLSHELTHTIQQGGHASSHIAHDTAPHVHTGSSGLVQMVGECAGKSKDACDGSCTHASGNPGTCRWSGTIKHGCVCYENPKLSPLKQVLYDLIIAALIAAGIVITVVAIAAIVACLSGPCEVAALIAALGYAGAMIVLGIIRSRGSDAESEAPPTAAAEGEEVGAEAMA